jgi:hypothetical protein
VLNNAKAHSPAAGTGLGWGRVEEWVGVSRLALRWRAAAGYVAAVGLAALLSGCSWFGGASAAGPVSTATPTLPPSVAKVASQVTFVVALPTRLPAGMAATPSASVISPKASKDDASTRALVLTYAARHAGGPSLEVSESTDAPPFSGKGVIHLRVAGHRADLEVFSKSATAPALGLWIAAHGVHFMLLSQGLSRAALLRVVRSLIGQ